MAFQPLSHRLLDAAKCGDVSLVIKLFKNKVSTALTDENGNSPLGIAVKNNHAFVAKLLIEYGADLEHPNNLLHRPLHLATMNDNLEILALLLSHGAQINVKNHEGFLPIQLAHPDRKGYKMLLDAQNGILPEEFAVINEVPVIPTYAIPVPKVKAEKGKKDKKKAGKKGKKKKKK